MPEQSTQPPESHVLYALHRRLKRWAWLLIVIADIDLVVWGLLAAAWPTGSSMLPASYEGFTQHAWAAVAAKTAAFITLEFRLFGVLCMTIGIMGVVIASTAFRRGERWAWWTLFLGNTVAFGTPMFYDRLVRTVEPFELTEYIGITLVYIALIITVPIREHDDAAPA